MSATQLLKAEFDRTAACGVSSGGSISLTAGTPEGVIRVDVSSVDTLACAVAEMRLETDRLRNCSLDELKERSEKLANRINYLLEPISPIEMDREGCTVQLRSKPPQQDDDGTRYFELLVQLDGIKLRRYEKQKSNPREPIASMLTREVVCRLAEDFLGVVS